MEDIKAGDEIMIGYVIPGICKAGEIGQCMLVDNDTSEPEYYIRFKNGKSWWTTRDVIEKFNR